MSVMESGNYRAIVVASQRASWFLSQLLRLHYSIRAHRPAGLFERGSECCLILAPTHQTIPDPALLMCALPYRCWRALIPVRPLATRTFSIGLLRFFKPIILVIYWFWGAIELPPMDEDSDETLPEKLQGLLEALRQGDVVMIFPEGEIGSEQEPFVGKFAPGVVYLHRVSGAPIVPIAFWLGERWWPRRRCAIWFGQPVRIPEHLDLDAGAEWLREQTLALREQAKEGATG
jgi:1-acyl-sn-glycerol-3-phosphate acyltransferase